MPTHDMTRALPEHLPSPIRVSLDAAVGAWVAALGPRLVSLVLFGSCGRGEASSRSDIDLLVIAAGFPRSLAARRRELLAAYAPVAEARRLPAVEWNLVTKTPEEARARSPLYLDMVYDARLLFDREGFFSSILDGLRTRLRELGSHRIVLPDGSWYWDLYPSFRFGDEVRI